MDELTLEVTEKENAEVERYLSDAIFSYGIEQLRGQAPIKAFSCYRNGSGGIAGAAMGMAMRNLFFVSHLFVEPGYRKRGLGERLLSRMEQSARRLGCDLLRLNTLNSKAHAFYLKSGFEQTARIHDYMNGFDLIYYHKSISPKA